MSDGAGVCLGIILYFHYSRPFDVVARRRLSTTHCSNNSHLVSMSMDMSSPLALPKKKKKQPTTVAK